MEDYESKAIRVWMREVMTNREWSANKWATKAGTSPSNITRFINGSKFTPSSKTLAKLIYVAGSSPVLSRASEINRENSRMIPVLFFDQTSAGTMSVYDLKGDIVAYIANTTDRCFDVNDRIVLRQQKTFDFGDVVVFLEDDKIMSATQTKGKDLIKLGATTETVVKSEVYILGKLVQVIKNFD